MTGKIILKELSKGIAITLAFFALIETLLRAAYLIRNPTVNEIPLPYVMGDDYGVVPLWVDGLRILEPDGTLFWKNRPYLRRKYIEMFGPSRTPEKRSPLFCPFLLILPNLLRDNPLWTISPGPRGQGYGFLGKKLTSDLRWVKRRTLWQFSTLS